MHYSAAREEDIPVIANMHIEPSMAKVKQRGDRSPLYRFYRDKVNFFFQCERDGVIVARGENEIVGFIIVTKSMSGLNRLNITKGYLIKAALKSVLGRYGFDRKMLRKLIRVPLAFFRISKRISKEEKGYGDIPYLDAKILALVVLKEKRRQGIGKKLLRQACRYLSEQGIEEVSVTTSINNSPAREIYEGLGFTARGFYKESHGETLYMTKNLCK